MFALYRKWSDKKPRERKIFTPDDSLQLPPSFPRATTSNTKTRNLSLILPLFYLLLPLSPGGSRGAPCFLLSSITGILSWMDDKQPAEDEEMTFEFFFFLVKWWKLFNASGFQGLCLCFLMGPLKDPSDAPTSDAPTSAFWDTEVRQVHLQCTLQVGQK